MNSHALLKLAISLGVRLTPKIALALSFLGLSTAGYIIYQLSNMPPAEEDVYDKERPWKRLNSRVYIACVGYGQERLEDVKLMFEALNPDVEIANIIEFESQPSNKMYFHVRPRKTPKDEEQAEW